MKFSVALALLLAAAPAALAATPDIRPDRITADVKTLASDAFEGRAVASAGETKTVEYLTAQFRVAGLQPGGDLQPGGGRAWTQNVPLVQAKIAGQASAGIEDHGQRTAWTNGEQVAMRPSFAGVSKVDIKDAPIVFAGYGVTAPERNWDDFKGVDVRGKVILVLVNDPDFETGEGDFGGKAMTWYGRWPYKFEEAARHGALGVLVIHETEPASYGWATVKNSNIATLSDIVRADPAKAHAVMEGWISREATIDLFRRSGLDFEAAKKAAQKRDFKPVALTPKFSASYAVDAKKVTSHNVVAMIPGTKRPDETVLYSAHWDHLGVGQPDASGDKIFNGAVDNAAGVALLLELARASAAAPKPERSIVFLSVTAEEQGLLGSEYYAQNPLFPLAKTVGDLNMDSPRPSSPARDFSASGNPQTTLRDDLIATGKTLGRSWVDDPRVAAGHFYRSDHFPMSKVGVPAFTLRSGDDLVEGGRAAGQAQLAAYNDKRYHQPADNFVASEWRSDGLAADARLMFDLGQSLANSRKWPTWYDGAEFKAERDKTAAVRR